MTKKAVFSPSVIEALVTGVLLDPYTPGLRVEVQANGKRVWKYVRRIARTGVIVKLSRGTYPAWSIAAAREWAGELNEKVLVGEDPRDAIRLEAHKTGMTVEKAHGLYMAAVREGTASRAKRINTPRTIVDKLKIYKTDIAPALRNRSIYEVTEKDLIELIRRKGKTAKVRVNRLAAELKVFFGWASSLRGLEIGLEIDPSRRLTDLRYPEAPRTRKLGLDEIEWFLRALILEPRDFRRGLILWLLTAVRFSELINARSEEVVDGVWTIPAERVKNRRTHRIALGPWGRHLMATNSEWVFPAERVEGPRKTGWYAARDRVHARMSEYAGRKLDRFQPHDLRRTARSNTKRLKVDFETAEAMLNHLRSGLERVYDGYDLEDEKAAWFLKWEKEITRLAVKAGVAPELEVPSPKASTALPSNARSEDGAA